MKIKIKKEDNKTPQKISAPGPKVRDIKTDKAKSVDYKEPINSRVIEIKEEKEEEKPKRSLKLLILPAAVGAVLIIAAVFAYFFVFSQPKDTLSKFAPKETFFYLHLNLGKLFQVPKNQNINSLLEKFGGRENLENGLDEFLNKNILAKYNLNLKNDIKPILGKEAAFALYSDENKKVFPYLLFKINDEKRFLSILEKIKPKDVQELNISGAKIKTLLFDNPANSFSFALIKDTAIISQNKEAIEKIVQAYQTKNYLLAKPRGRNFIQIYLNGEILPQTLLNFLPENFQKNNLLLYYLLLKNQNGSFEIDDAKDGLLANYSSKADSKNRASLSKLLPFLPNEAVFAFLDYNLKNEYLEIKENLQKKDKGEVLEKERSFAGKYFKDFEKEMKQKYNLDVETDVLPFFEKEAAFVLLPKTDGKQNFVFLAKTEEAEKFEKNLKNILINFFAAANLKEKPLALADGTEAIELVPDKKAYEVKEENKGEIKISNLVKKADGKTLISYAIKNDVLVIAQNKETFQKIINDEEKLTANSLFSKPYQKINGQKMDSLLYFNVPAYLGYLDKSSSSQAFWSPIKSFLFGTKTKSDQTSGKGFLLVE